MENEHQKNDIQKIIQLPAQEEALKHHQVHERSVWIQKALKYNQKNEKGQLQKCVLYLLLRIRSSLWNPSDGSCVQYRSRSVHLDKYP